MKLEADAPRAPLFLFLSRALKIIVFYRHDWQCSRQELNVRQELLVVDRHRHEFTRTNLSISPFLARLYRRLIIRYLG
jgi:hypothetical protein